MMRFLIDECLSIDLLTIAEQSGCEAQHIARIGKAGWKDWNVMRYASAGDFILVTNNASDFRRLYTANPLHAGLIIIIPNLPRQGQKQLFQIVLAELAVMGEPINCVVEVSINGDDIVLDRYELPGNYQS